MAAFLAPVGILSFSNETLVLLALLGITICCVPLLMAYKKRSALHRAIARELMKFRRIYHLAKHLGSNQDDHRPWFTELHANIMGYLSFFANKKTHDYFASDEVFRKVSYHIYGAPDLIKKKDEVLYAELLDTTSDVASTRQEIKEIMLSGMSVSERMTMYCITNGIILAILFGGASLNKSATLFSGLLAVIVFLMSEMLARVDSLVDVANTMPQRYADNIAKLELRRREEE